MVYISKLSCNKNIYSLYTYKPYDDNRFFNKIDSLICEEDNLSDNYLRIIEEYVNLYKDELVFNLTCKRNYDYICPVISNDKFYKLNKMISKSLSDELNVPLLLDFFNEPSMNKIDYKDKYTKDETVEFTVNEKYIDKDILFIDTLTSTGVVLNYIGSKFSDKSYVDFITVGVRFNAPDISNTQIQSVEELDFKLDCLYNDGYVVEIKGLFNKKDVKVDLRRNLSIVIGANGDGKTTAYKIATLATSGYLEDILQLCKFYFNSIHINYFKDNQLATTKTIEYKDVIPSRKRIIKLFNPKESDKANINEIRTTLIKRLKTIIDLSYAKDVIKKKNRKFLVRFLRKITDEEYISIYRKIIYGDNTCNNDIIKLLRKNNLDVKYNIIKDLLNLLVNNSFIKDDSSLIETFVFNYFDCTTSRKLTQKIYKREIIFDDETGIEFEDYADEYFYDEPETYNEVPEYEENYKMQEMAEEDYRWSHINEYSDDYYEEYDGYNGMDVEPDDRDIEDYYDRMAEYEDRMYSGYEHTRWDADYFPGFTLKNGLCCLYPYELVKSYMLEKRTSRFKQKELYVDGLVIRNMDYLDIINDYVKSLENYNTHENNIDEHLESELNDYLVKNQYLIQFGLYSVLDKVGFEKLSNCLKNKQMKNRREFIDSFKKIVESTKNRITNKTLIIEKILNKYYVNKTVTILNNTIYVLDKENNYIPINSLSAGERNLMLILLYICINDNSIILDEPELSMNITWQNELIKDIFRLQHPNQRFIILTQTPALVSYPELTKFLSSVNNNDNNNYEYSSYIGGTYDEIIEEETSTNKTIIEFFDLPF